jgi:vacuolar iron transporter family protein
MSRRKVHHTEKHNDYGDVIRDVIIGFADGLTVPFALTAGLSSLGSARLVIIGGMSTCLTVWEFTSQSDANIRQFIHRTILGLAELFSGAISMGLGAYLAAVTERDHYTSEEKREREEVLIKPEDEKEEIYEIMDNYGISREASKSLVDSLCQEPENWIRVSVLSIQLIRN